VYDHIIWPHLEEITITLLKKVLLWILAAFSFVGMVVLVASQTGVLIEDETGTNTLLTELVEESVMTYTLEDDMSIFGENESITGEGSVIVRTEGEIIILSFSEGGIIGLNISQLGSVYTLEEAFMVTEDETIWIYAEGSLAEGEFEIPTYKELEELLFDEYEIE